MSRGGGASGEIERDRSSKLTVEMAQVVAMFYIAAHVVLRRMIEARVVGVQE